MRLSQPLFQMPVVFDAARLQAEIAALPEEAWVPHPDHVAGNSALRLISAGGRESDSMHGRMLPTGWLEAMPYVRQVLAVFGVVWGRSRLMRLAPGAEVPEHADINYHWFSRTRLHVPVFTNPDVRFHCDGTCVHMAPGEAWVLDNWRRHHVENGSGQDRVHIVADTSGTVGFWNLAKSSPPRANWRRLSWNPASDARVLTERNERTVIMPAAEVQLLIEDLRDELVADVEQAGSGDRLARFCAVLENFVLDWRQLCAAHGLGGEERSGFERLAETVHSYAAAVSEGLTMRTNQVSALHVLERRVLQHLIVDPAQV